MEGWTLLLLHSHWLCSELFGQPLHRFGSVDFSVLPSSILLRLLRHFSVSSLRCLPLHSSCFTAIDTTMNATPNRMQRTPRSRLGYKHDITGAGSVSRSVRRRAQVALMRCD